MEYNVTSTFKLSIKKKQIKETFLNLNAVFCMYFSRDKLNFTYMGDNASV